MEDYPNKIMDFETKFKTEEACRDYLFQLRWPNGFQCPRCSNDKAWPLKNALYQCSHCNHKISVKAGTIFHRTHKHLEYYLDEFTFRFNRRKSTIGKLFYRLLQNAVSIEPTTYKQIRKNVRGKEIHYM